jgi:hypothetical protein
MRFRDLKEKIKKGVIVFAAINLALFYSLTGLASTAQAASYTSEWIVTDDSAVYSDPTIATWPNEGLIDWPDQGYNDNGVHFYNPHNTGETATWNLNQNYNGAYDVYVSWSTHSGELRNRGTSVDYTLNHANGSVNDSINQRELADQVTVGGSGQFSGWYKLGNDIELYASSGSVVMTDSSTDGYAIADEVRIELENAYPVETSPFSPNQYYNNKTVNFDFEDFSDPDGNDADLEYVLEWKNGTTGSMTENVSEFTKTFSSQGDYQVRVGARDLDGGETFSSWRTITIDTVAPTVSIDKADPAIAGHDNLREGRKEKLSLKSTADDLLSGVDSYKWSFDSSVIFDKEDGVSEYFYTDTPGTYTLKLDVMDKAGNKTTETLDLDVLNNLPDTPALSMTRDDGIIKLKWNKVADTRGYQIIKNGLPIQDNNDLLSPGTTSYTDYDVSNGTSYEYRVRAYDQDAGYQSEYARSNAQEVYVPEPEVEFVTVASTATGGSVVANDAAQIGQDNGEVKADETQPDSEVDGQEEQKAEETSEEAQTNWPMIIAIIIAATIVLGGAAYWWYGISEDEDQI